MCAVVWVAYGVTAGQQAGVMRCREHGCVDVCVMGVVNGPTARALRHGMWLLSVMTVTIVVGVCMVCACVLGVCAWRVRVCFCLDWAAAGCAVWAVLTRVSPGLTWTGPRAGADVLTGVA